MALVAELAPVAREPRVLQARVARLGNGRERGLVVSAGSTDDGLPLHALTDEGRTEAAAWLTGDGASPEEDWDDVLDRVMLASSLSGADLAAVLAAEGLTDVQVVA